MARTFGDLTTDKIQWSGGISVRSQTAASVVLWFRLGNIATNDHGMFVDYADFDNIALLVIQSAGQLYGLFRTPSGLADVTATGPWDDGAWHRAALVRRNASPYLELYVDGVSQASSTDDPGTSATAATNTSWGNINPEVANSGFGGELARCAFIAGTALTVAEADRFLFTGHIDYPLTQWLEMDGMALEWDRSGNLLHGTPVDAVGRTIDPPSIVPVMPRPRVRWADVLSAPAVGNIPEMQRAYRARRVA